MCCNDFWKKITVFSITLLVGFFAAGLFRNDKAINVKVSVPIIENSLSSEDVSPTLPQTKRKDCVPADSSLKYQNLPYDGSGTEARELKTDNLIEILSKIEKTKLDKKELEKSGKKNDKAIQTEIKRLDRENENLHELLRQFDNFPQQRNLLYVERCSEYGESMKVIPPIEK